MKQYLIYNNTNLNIGKENTIFSVLNFNSPSMFKETISYLGKAEGYLELAVQNPDDEYDPFEDFDEMESMFSVREFDNNTYIKNLKKYIVKNEVFIKDQYDVIAKTLYLFKNNDKIQKNIYFVVFHNEIFVYTNADQYFDIKYLKVANPTVKILEHIKCSYTEQEVESKLIELKKKYEQ